MESQSRLESPPVAGGDESPETKGPELSEIEESLRERPSAFGFFQAVRLLERLFPEKARVGRWEDPREEVARFGVLPRLAFSPSEIHALELEADGEGAGEGERPARIDVNFMGLVGPQGVLPLEYTQLVADRYRAGDRALGAFLDLFHHRFISLFYRAWRKSRLDLHVEDPPGRVSLVRHLLDLLGLGPEPFQDRQSVPDDTLIYYAGLLAPQPRGAAALRQLVEDRTGVEVEVEEFVGGWFPLPERDRCRLGDETASTRLGRGAVVGDEIWDQQSKVRLRLGPLDRDAYHAFLPGGEMHEELEGLLRFFAHDQFEFEVQLVLRAGEVPGVVLGASDDPYGQPLGWCTWLRSRPRTTDADETILDL